MGKGMKQGQGRDKEGRRKGRRERGGRRLIRGPFDDSSVFGRLIRFFTFIVNFLECHQVR